MSKNIKIHLFLFLSISITPCNGQVNPDLQKDSTSQPNIINLKQIGLSSPDNDPYFIENTEIISAYGPRVITRNILQDKNDAFWLATWNGLIRYDGTSFTNFTNKFGLRPYRIFSLLEDKKQNLWFGSIGAGVYFFDGTFFINFTTREGLGDNEVECMFEDKTGNIWFGTGAGVSCCDGKTFRNFTVADGLLDTDVHSIAQDGTGKIWIGSTAGICIYDGKSFTQFANEAGLPFKNVRTIITDTNGNVWFGGNDGLFRYDGQSLVNLTTDFVGYLYEDKKGNIWISAAQGSKSGKMTLYRYPIKSFPLPIGSDLFSQIITEDGMIFGILEDKKDNIWFGTLGGVCRYDGKTFNYFRDKEAKE